MRKATFLFISLITLAGCIQHQDEGKLPILGPREAEHKTVDGKDLIDTLYHTIDNFQFVNQDSAIVNNETFKGKYYVADFFFTSCPTICPIMSANMLTLYDDFKGEPNLNFLSHTIDTRHDSVKVLKRYSTKLGVSSDRWHFVTGPKDDIYGIAKSYLVSAKEGHVGNNYNLSMKCWVNDQLVSAGNVKDMDWTFAEIIERSSYGVTIYPGDVIGSGTVGTGCFLELNGTGKLNDPNYQAQWLQPNDEVKMEIDGLGTLVNTIHAEATDWSILSLKK